jgi:hypothetical protein
MLNRPLFRLLSWQHDLKLDDPRGSNQKYVNRLLEELRRSQYIGKAILLAMDGAYQANGRLDLEKTDLLVSNDYVLRTARTYPKEFLPGVSINPQRRDAIDELDRCVEAGAHLVKALPNAQGFDPADRGFIAFYQRLAKHKIPFLSHSGYEFTLLGNDQSAGDPNRLRLALEQGVTVIAAHGCSTGLILYEKYYRTFLDLAAQYPNFFADVSALTLPSRFGMLLRLRRHPELSSRLLFGTDYPFPVFHLPCWGRTSFRALLQIIRTSNRFYRKYLILKALGVGVCSFEQINRSAI